MALTHTGLQQTSLQLAVVTTYPIYSAFCNQQTELACQHLSSTFDSQSFFEPNHIFSSGTTNYTDNNASFNSLLLHQPLLNQNLALSKVKLNMDIISPNDESLLICNDGMHRQSKSMGNFASALINSQPNRHDSHNNNQHNSAHCLPIDVPSNGCNSMEDVRVPVNGEISPDQSTNPGLIAMTSQVKQEFTPRRDPSTEPHNCINITNINHLANKMRDLSTGTEPWRDDSLSMFSSISSSMSSLPSPPSPASPPPFRPQSLPQTGDIVLPSLDVDPLSSSLPDPGFFTTYCSNSSVGSARKARVKDDEGFIRRAACLCVNQQETEVLLVSSKSSNEVWIVPGGGLEEGENAEDAAIREAQEEAGVRGTILAYLGLFESQSERTNSGKKHRTAVYVMAVKSLDDVYPEYTAIGRLRKWMPFEEAAAHLTRHRPQQSVFLQLLKVNRLKSTITEDDSSESKTSSDTSCASSDEADESTPVLTNGIANGNATAENMPSQINNSDQSMEVKTVLSTKSTVNTSVNSLVCTMISSENSQMNNEVLLNTNCCDFKPILKSDDEVCVNETTLENTVQQEQPVALKSVLHKLEYEVQSNDSSKMPNSLVENDLKGVEHEVIFMGNQMLPEMRDLDTL